MCDHGRDLVRSAPVDGPFEALPICSIVAAFCCRDHGDPTRWHNRHLKFVRLADALIPY